MNDPVKGLSTDWLKHLETPESRKSFALKIRSLQNDPVFKRLIEIVKDKRASLLKGPGPLDEYDSPSWSHKQADINGQVRALNLILNLIDL